MNLYRGCSHGCIYCDSRSEIYRKTYSFEDIEVKTNACTLLESELSKRRAKSMIVTGAMTDPYIPLEKDLQHTRKSLELILKYGFGAAILTKSDLVLRDIDILRELNRQTKVVVQMTLTTYDEKLCSKLEPNVCTTKRRFEVLKILADESIPTVVWLTPTLPYINDTTENLEGILNYCKEARVKGILTFGFGMTLRSGNREYFYKMLDTHFPNLKKEYIRKFGSRYGLGSENSKTLSKIARKFCKDNGILYGEKAVFNYIYKFPKDEQISFF